MAKKNYTEEEVVRRAVNSDIGDSVYEFLNIRCDNILNVIESLGCTKEEAIALVTDEIDKIGKEYDNRNLLRRKHEL